MGNFFIASLTTVSATTWIYFQLLRRNGGQKRAAATASIGVGVVLLILLMITLQTFSK